MPDRTDIVDVEVDPLAERQRRRQTLLRIGLPIGGVGLIIGFLLGITIYADSANRAGVLDLSGTLLRSTQERIALQVSAYLEPAAHAALLAHSMLGREGATSRANEARTFSASILAETPQIENVLFADAQGNFMLVTRASNGPPNAIDTKRILLSAGKRSVEWTTSDASGKIISQHADPKDNYDARTRSWFIGARAINEVFWSDVYVFFSEQAPGITAAVHGPDPDPDVVGVDIRLDAISRFLGGLSIGRTGRAYIATRDGRMVAGPDPAHILTKQDGTLMPARVDAVGDPRLAASWDHFRTQGPGNRIIGVNGERMISIVTPLANNTQGWLLFITVPEAEFSGFVAVNSRRTALLSLIVVALAAGLAALVVRQGLRADRAARTVAERSTVLRQQSAAFARLAEEAGMFDAEGRPPAALAETLAEATGARRAGIWRLSEGRQALHCDDSFEPATGARLTGLELSRQELPALIEALAAGETIDTPDARRDRRTAAFHGSIMTQIGSVALFAVPVTKAGQPIGMVTLEDPRRDLAGIDFARACATLVGLGTPAALSGAETDAPPLIPTGMLSETEPSLDEHGFDPILAASGTIDETHTRAVVLVLRLPDTEESLTHQAACAAQEITAAHGIPYVKMMGTTIVAATGYGIRTGSDLAEAATRLADVAIALRERCIVLFEGTDGLAAFSMGLDVGIIFGARLGSAPGLFNIWGEVMQGAGALASSAPTEAIQTSEQAYLLLRQNFLFRPRGLFHRPHTGAARSYVLAGRA
ncbi:GAF domain-containing protein [Acidisphaera sp. S103]|uniref:GAF domain-containing protein n=1 Tax=Acidisphaera sp. S103 TaxID=1747223 RepID=UPI00131AA5D3|nr:cache domain-containing protein [Acidisphaera sp. S103]